MAIEKVDFSITTGQRGRAEQEKAAAEGHSKAHFGSSPHNFAPALAVDVLPYPFDGDWNAPRLIERLREISQIFIVCGNSIGVPIVWGGCGTNGWEKIHDYPHMQLANWRALAADLPLAE